MPAYKVPQDVEAEDKLLGPFTFKQFIFLIVMFAGMFVVIQLLRVNPLLAIFPLPIVIVAGVLGIYRRPDQPVEVYLAAVLRFYLKPRKRVWKQDGYYETVEITAPPRIEHLYSDGMNEAEVMGRLSTLAQIMDSRGWATRNAEYVPNTPGQVTQPQMIVEASDRLIAPSQLPSVGDPTEVHEYEDMLDVENNPTAQNFDMMVQQAAESARTDAIDRMRLSTNPYASQPPSTSSSPFSNNTNNYQVSQQQAQSSTSTVTQPVSPDIIRLAQNSDRNVSSIAREADETLNNNQEISLH